MTYGEAKKALQLIEEYVAEEATRISLVEQRCDVCDARIKAIDVAVEKIDNSLGLTIKQIANYTGNILNSVGIINVFTEFGRKGALDAMTSQP